MTQGQVDSSRQKYVPYFDGIRGYGFLLVFCVHYFPPDYIASAGSNALRFWIGMKPITLLAVPTFFVLSGYLIGGILHGTRDREGYFKVFYGRRIARVFPLYYLALLIVAVVEFSLRFHLDYHFWTHFLFIQNLVPGYSAYRSPAALNHFWSLATEEQFYLIWPLVVWFFPERRKLFGIASMFIVLIFGIRFAAPHFYKSADRIHLLSFTRADAILLGVLLALIRHEAVFERIKPFAKWIALAGTAAFVAWALEKGQSWPYSFRGVQIAIPWINFTALAIIIAVMEEKSWLNRVCSKTWICWLGKRSYSLYVLHLLYFRIFTSYVIPPLAHRMSHEIAVVVSGMLALCLTVFFATLTYQFIEIPTQSLKKRLKYGPVREDSSAQRLGERVLVQTGT